MRIQGLVVRAGGPGSGMCNYSLVPRSEEDERRDNNDEREIAAANHRSCRLQLYGNVFAVQV